jgi:hypothetical protein
MKALSSFVLTEKYYVMIQACFENYQKSVLKHCWKINRREVCSFFVYFSIPVLFSLEGGCSVDFS